MLLVRSPFPSVFLRIVELKIDAYVEGVDTVLRLSTKDNNRPGVHFKWSLGHCSPGPTAARMWICTALGCHPRSVGFSSSLYSCTRCIHRYLFVFWWVSFSLDHGRWMATQHPKPMEKKCQELRVSPELLRDGMLSGHCKPDGNRIFNMP